MKGSRRGRASSLVHCAARAADRRLASKMYLELDQVS